MTLQTTPITPIPANLDGTIDQPTWGESGGPFSAPPDEATGKAPGDPLPANTVNYEWQHLARHSRGHLDALVLSTEGLFTSCVVKQGTWNLNAGTLDITLTPTRVVVDFAQDGGQVFELYAGAGSPLALPALSDSYVDIDDAGAVTVSSVANAAPAPPVAANSVRIYKLVTDATELTSATLEAGVAPFPCLGPVVGAADLQANQVTVGTKLTSSTEAELNGTNNINGTTQIGEDATDSLTVEATATINGPATHNAIEVFNEEIRVAKRILLQQGVTPATTGELARDTSAEMLYHNGGRLAAPSISVVKIDTSVQPVVPASTILYLETSDSEAIGAPVRLALMFTAYLTRLAGSGTITIKIEESPALPAPPSWSTVGGNTFAPTVGTTALLVSMASVKIPDPAKTIYRVSLDGGASNIEARQSRLVIVPG